MRTIIIETVDHTDQRYDTSGDWQTGQNPAEAHLIRVSKLGNDYFEHLVAIHEYIEMVWCLKHGVTAGAVDAFDMAWTPHNGYEEPGDDPAAPYYVGHQLALGVERILAANLGVWWDCYEAAFAALPKWEAKA